MPQDLKCSFCGKPQATVGCLIAGPNVYICDECVDLCAIVIAEYREKKQQVELAELCSDPYAAPPSP